MKTRVIYVCEYCGDEFDSNELCKEHEDRCCNREVAVRVSLACDNDQQFSFVINSVEPRKLVLTQIYEEVYGSDCDYFSIVSNDTSDKHIEELKKKLLNKAIETITRIREENLKHIDKMLRSLEDIKHEN